MKKHKKLLLAVLVMILWGSLFPMIKLSYRFFGLDTGFIPNIILFAGVRFVICGAIITLYAKFRKKNMTLKKREKFSVFAVGFFAVILHYSLTYSGLAVTDSSVTALVKQLGGFVFIPLSFLFFKEDRFSVNKLIGAILGFGGIVVLNLHPEGFSVGIGEILVILASVCTVASNVCGKNAMKTIDSNVLTGYSQLFGGCVLLAVGVALGGDIGKLNLPAVMVFCYICMASVFGYCIWNHLVCTSDLSQLFIVKFLEPIFAAVFGMLLLKEDVWDSRFLLAVSFTIAAVLVSNYNGKKEIQK